MSSRLPKINHALRTDVGRKRLANEDALSSDPRLNLFVVCDGIGGRPSGEAASQIIAHTYAHALRRRLRGLPRLDEATLKWLLVDAAVDMNQQMFEHAQAVPALLGMGCTLVAALIEAHKLFYLHAGDSRLYLLRDQQLRQLTADHVHTRPQYKTRPDTGDRIDAGERRLLMQYIGSPDPLQPSVASHDLQPGDRLLLCSDGLTDPVSDDILQRILTTYPDPDDAATVLIKAANAGGGPDNITVAVLDYQGHRPATAEDRKLPPRGKRQLPHGIAEQTRLALDQLEQDLLWLQQGARETAHPRRLTALAAAKRRLGPTAYREFLEHDPDQPPSHVFHRCCTAPDSAWRQRYHPHLQQLEIPLQQITAGNVRLSPVLTAQQTAAIFGDLWKGWRRVEQRYFATTQRDADTHSPVTSNDLIDHMLHSVQTLAGLLWFLPRFMREKN